MSVSTLAATVAVRHSTANDCWSRGTAGEPAVSLPWFSPYLTAGKATQGTHAARHSPLRGGTVDEDKSWETKVTGESKNEPKSAVQALNKIIHHSVAASKYKVQILWSLQTEYITTDQQLQGQTFTEAQNFGQDNRLTAIQPVLTAWPQWDKAAADSSLKYSTSIQHH